MGLFGRKKAMAEAAALAGRLVPDRCWDDVALDAGVDAVEEGHLKAAVALLRECRDEHELRTQRVRALGEAAVGQSGDIRAMMSLGMDPTEAADLLLLLGSTLLAEAWRIRGMGWARALEDDRRKLFTARLRDARDPLMAAAKLAPADATPWVELQRYARGIGLEAGQRDVVWLEAMRRCPTSYPAHAARLQSLSRTWGGSHEDMFSFARDTVAKSVPGSPLAAMLPIAHAEYLVSEGDGLISQGRTWAYVKLRARYFDDALTTELVAAERRWRTSAQETTYSKEAHNLFGWAMLEAGEHERARGHLAFVGDRPSSMPWDYAGEHAFARARVRLGLT